MHKRRNNPSLHAALEGMFIALPFRSYQNNGYQTARLNFVAADTEQAAEPHADH